MNDRLSIVLDLLISPLKRDWSQVSKWSSFKLAFCEFCYQKKHLKSRNLIQRD